MISQLFYIGLASFLVVLNGFFVAAEFGLVKLRQTRIEEIKTGHGARGRVLAIVHSHLDTYLSACQLGITLASLGLGWIGEPAFARLLEPLLHSLGLFSSVSIQAISFTIAFLVITFLHIVIGELAPKTLAIRQPQQISLWTALPLYYFYWLMYPFIWLLNKSANLTLFLLGSTAQQESESTHYSAEELKLILHGSHLHGEIDKEEVEILDNVLDFADLKVADIMRAFDEMLTLSLNDTLEENIKKIAHYRYSRYPLTENNSQNIVGLVHVKDIFLAMQTAPLVSLRSVMRPALIVPTHLPALDLFRQFRLGFSHFAIVTHGDRKIVGFITLENVLNALLGQIRDEFIKAPSPWVQTKEGALIMKGNTPIYELEKALNIELIDTQVNTIAGLLLEKLQRMPKINERVRFEAFDIAASKIKGPQILLVKIFPKKPSSIQNHM